MGWSSLLIVPVVVIAGIVMMKLMIQGQARYPPNLVYLLAFVDTLTLFGFSLLYFLALYFRKNLMLHSRFMVSTIFGPLIPALARMFLFNFGLASSLTEGITYSYVLIELVLIIMIWVERDKKEIKLTYVPFLIFIVAQHVLMYFSSDWAWWKSLMDSFANYSS